ncbi:hypothetical protein [Vreelandella nigrificans]|uniref:Uncharacterized protein n=1 Tax=Vreelandella nigrificans TaxID=2042704 RepID=A0A2A4HJ23_9GAMM|nr:hypothetical protein [Halomonas nigrificans]PCF94093.1 hypothetical protein CPA45_19135 [Halomonas nigrificans]
MEKSGKTDGWSDGWHTHASTGDSLCVLRDSVVGAAKSAVKTAATDDTNDKGKPDGWSDDWHANASPRESLGALCGSAIKATTTREGWLKIARGTGKVAAVSAAVGFVVLRNALEDSQPDHLKNGLLENDLLENDLLENDLIENESIDGDRTYL